MRMPKHWALILAGCAIAAIVAERVLVLYESEASLVAVSEADHARCVKGPAPPPFEDEAVPSVTQPGGIDPLGLSRAIRNALEDCP